MWCDPPSVPSADVLQPTQTNWSAPLSTVNNEKKQLSFVYQPGVGLYDKKVEVDEDLRITSTITDVDERRQSSEHSPIISPSTSDVDHRRSYSSTSDTKSNDLYKSCLRRQNEQDSIPIRPKLFSADDITLRKSASSSSSLSDKEHSQIKSSDVNILPNQENNQKRKVEPNDLSSKKLRQSTSRMFDNSKCEKNLLDEELNRQKTKLGITKQPKFKLRVNRPEQSQKQPITTIIKNIPLVKKLSSENYKQQTSTIDKDTSAIPSQGLLLCPKDEPIKKKKKKKIAPIITSSTELLDDDSVLDSILFNEMQSVQQQWQQFLTLTMEKELHINPCDGKRKAKINKFDRTNEFLLAYEHLYDFEGMKHWYPTSR
ncbi:hypothetical protein I4U23_029306 [Adineta vaga]|nr:hypothetical protein I4U23_029306 [Adineta vaga]